MDFSDTLTLKWNEFVKIINDIKTHCNTPNFEKLEKSTRLFLKTARKLRDYIKKQSNKLENIIAERLLEMKECCYGLVNAVKHVCSEHFCVYSPTQKATEDICVDFIETVKPLIKELEFLYQLSNVESKSMIIK